MHASPLEVIVAHLLTQTVVVAGQMIAVLVFALAVFGIPLVGNLGLYRRTAPPHSLQHSS